MKGIARGLAVRNANFRYFIISRTIYALAMSALPVLLSMRVVASGGGLAEVGWVLGIGAIPGVLAALIAPSLLRRISQRGLFMSVCIVWAIGCGSMAVVEACRQVNVIHFILASLVLEVVGATLYPAVGSYLPVLVDRADLQGANAVKSMFIGGAGILGPVVASVMATWAHPQWGWVLLCVLMILAGGVQAIMPRGKMGRVESSSMVGDLKRGIGFCLEARGVLAVVLYSGLWHLVGFSILITAGPWVSSHVYHLPWLWGALESAMAAGMLIGAPLAMWVPRNVRWVCIPAMFPMLIELALLVAGAHEVLVIVAAVLSGASLTIGGIVWVTALQNEVPQDFLPSVFSFDYVFSEGLAPLGYLVVPLLAGLLGYQLVGLGICLLLLVIGVATVVLFPRSLVGGVSEKGRMG